MKMMLTNFEVWILAAVLYLAGFGIGAAWGFWHAHNKIYNKLARFWDQNKYK